MSRASPAERVRRTLVYSTWLPENSAVITSAGTSTMTGPGRPFFSASKARRIAGNDVGYTDAARPGSAAGPTKLDDAGTARNGRQATLHRARSAANHAPAYAARPTESKPR